MREARFGNAMAFAEALEAARLLSPGSRFRLAVLERALEQAIKFGNHRVSAGPGGRRAETGLNWLNLITRTIRSAQHGQGYP